MLSKLLSELQQHLHGCVATEGAASRSLQVGNLTFRADFDSGNLREAKAGSQADEYMLYPRPDNWGTPWQSGHRSWFYFAVKGHARGDTVTFIVVRAAHRCYAAAGGPGI